MGKVVKYCSTCEEGFAEKFGFCPNCGSNLQAFEMNPLGNKPAEEMITEPVQTVNAAAPPIVETPAEPEAPQISETQTFSAAADTEPAETKESFAFGDEVFDEPEAETKPL